MKNTNKLKVIAVIVTYNRLELLKRVIHAVKSQSEKVSSIIVVDNASTDGTCAYLEIETNINKELIHHRVPRNSGGAGGFYYGIELALRFNPDLVWLMDDDGYPSEECLARLLEKSNNQNSILNPIVVNSSDNSLLSFGLGKNISTLADAKVASEGEIIKGVGSPFNGTLISKKLICEIGLPKKEMFIWGDEAEYVLRAKSKGTQIDTAVDSIFFHPASKSDYDLFLNKYTIELKPIRLAGNHYRNGAYINLRYYGIIKLIKYIIINFAYFISRRRFREACTFLIYALDGGCNTFILPSIRE
jgi:rhamnopyranosyl-N-acetylglucosaminyl-diphospho-decaprenol beta-1,3/1,4-galactofuranosyltransferase